MGELDIFTIRLRVLRRRMEMTQKEFSEFTDIRQQTLSGYENGKIKPPIDIVKNIAEKCEVSIDWLCGISDTLTLGNHTTPKTYSDVINLLFNIEDAGVLYEEIQHGSYEIESEYIPVEFKDHQLKLFIMQWCRMKYVLQKNMIDQTGYNDWKTGILEKYSKIKLSEDIEELKDIK